MFLYLFIVKVTLCKALKPCLVKAALNTRQAIEGKKAVSEVTLTVTQTWSGFFKRTVLYLFYFIH